MNLDEPCWSAKRGNDLEKGGIKGVSGGGSKMGRVTHKHTLCVSLIPPANTALARFHHESAMK